MRKHLRFILLLIFAVFILWFFGRNLDWKEVAQSIQKANLAYLAAATSIICLGYLLRALRWKTLLAPLAETSLKELFATTTVGFAAVFFIGRAGEIVRPMWLPMRDKRVRPSAALVTLFLERIFDLAALASFFAINLIWFPSPKGREAEFTYVQAAGMMLLGGVVAGIIGLAIFQRYSTSLIALAERLTDRKFIPGRLRRIFLSLMRQLANALKILKDWRELLAIAFWTVSLWFAIAIPTWLILLAFGLPLGFSDSLFIMGFAAVSSVVPTPGGAAGAFHTATAASLIFLNIDQDQAAATSIVMHLIYFAPAVFFGLYYFIRGDISLARMQNLLSSEHAAGEMEQERENSVQAGIAS